jgi:hypothetical protein
VGGSLGVGKSLSASKKWYGAYEVSFGVGWFFK